MSFNYVNYVNSFYSNDPVVLKKRRKQAKAMSIASATIGTAAAGLSCLPKNKLSWLTIALSVLSLLGALNSYRYGKLADKKLAELNANA